MFNAFERAVAFRYLRARKGERFVSIIGMFSLIGIALGVATLIIVMAVMNGFREELLGRILGLNGHIGVYAVGGPMTDFDPLVARIRGTPGVVSATPIVEGQVLITSERGGASGGLARGVRVADLRARAIIADNIRMGSLDDFQGEDAIAIGIGLANRLRVTVGDRITLVSPQGRTTVFGTVPRTRTYEVVALFQVGMNEYDSTFAFMPLENAQLFFQRQNAITQIEVFVRDPTRVWSVMRDIRERAGVPVQVVSWAEANSSFFNAVQVQRNVLFLILTLIIIVAAFNIISSLIMMVKDKGKDIAILRTMGATRGAIMRIFLLAGASVGVAGTIAGFLLGITFCWRIDDIRRGLEWMLDRDLFSAEVYYLTRLPAIVDYGEVVQVTVMALVLSLVATLYPSWRAAKTDPVEMLRNE